MRNFFLFSYVTYLPLKEKYFITKLRKPLKNIDKISSFSNNFVRQDCIILMMKHDLKSLVENYHDNF